MTESLFAVTCRIMDFEGTYTDCMVYVIYELYEWVGLRISTGSQVNLKN